MGKKMENEKSKKHTQKNGAIKCEKGKDWRFVRTRNHLKKEETQRKVKDIILGKDVVLQKRLRKKE